MGAVKHKKRGRVTRTRNKIILISAEGKNKTEKLYFADYFRDKQSYRIRFTTSNDTDPEGIVKAAISFIASEELRLDEGDLAFRLVDSDTDQNKQTQIYKAYNLASKQKIQLIISNPCFEVWFLQHFRYSTKGYVSNADVLDDLKQYISDYRKNETVYAWIADREDKAIHNAKKLEEYHRNLGRKLIDMECNPSTGVYKILEMVNQI